jgi:hypothetical protein
MNGCYGTGQSKLSTQIAFSEEATYRFVAVFWSLHGFHFLIVVGVCYTRFPAEFAISDALSDALADVCCSVCQVIVRSQLLVQRCGVGSRWNRLQQFGLFGLDFWDLSKLDK